MDLRSFVRQAAVLLTGLTVLACGNREVGTDPGSAVLEVIVNTPIANAGAVAIHGPASSISYVSSTDTLRGLVPGQYDAHADNSAAPDSLVSPVLTGVVTGSPVMVELGQMDSVTATYALRGGSGALWVGKWGSANLAEGFTSPQLATAGTVEAADTIRAASAPSTISGTAFDTAGNMWVTDYLNQQIMKFTPAQLASGGAQPPTVMIHTAKEPWGIALDANGNLWVGFYNGNDVLEYAAADVEGWSGTLTDPAPVLTITTPNGPLALAFDAGGSLWVAGFDVPMTYEIASSAIGAASAGGTIVPTDSLVSTFLKHGSGLAFDRAGNLWEGTEAGYLVGYTSSQLGTEPHGEPNFAQQSPSYRFDELAFDNSGNLWAATETADVAMFSPSQLTSGDVTAPARTLTAGSGERTFALGFDTHLAALPIAPAYGVVASVLAPLRSAPPQVQARDGSRPGSLQRR
jgi:sugar lactone lactonase YvrE